MGFMMVRFDLSMYELVVCVFYAWSDQVTDGLVTPTTQVGPVELSALRNSGDRVKPALGRLSNHS